MGKGVGALFKGIAGAVNKLGKDIVGLLKKPFKESGMGKEISLVDMRRLFQSTTDQRDPDTGTDGQYTR